MAPFMIASEGSIASRSSDELEVLHSKAQLHFRIKLEKVKKRNPCPDITIYEFYFDREKSSVKNVPHDLQLEFYFANYNAFTESGFQPQRDRNFDIVRAIWYYNLDHRHSFSRHFQGIRYNIILMVFLWAGRILESGTVDGICDDECGTFWYTYICAWMESLDNPTEFTKRDAFINVWVKSKYDLITFPRTYLQRIKKLVGTIKEMVTSTKFPPSEFIARCEDHSIDEALFAKEGFILALKWALTKEGDAQPEEMSSKVDAQAYEDLPPIRRRYTPEDVAIVEESLTEPERRTLCDVPWNSAHVKALLVDVDMSARGSGIEMDGRVHWMDMDKAEELLKRVTVDDITKMCATLGVADYGNNGDVMDMDMT
ncbi:uncharacterized protein K460DRAFT_404083 [Cucurbitaria berberidis CBS 394.84]|uniref:Uncharacterized protein n=1 Tax=Cucurbitaria berberidis CBS 394.84 TaxID=1168544 RepID=A0A9P4GPK6_9PLEO|nr:uncharacterized protein K460DRAFT_404083 [Cucurbitaria berberidis CBS 394.84]KAF1848816.1 hypothetical protein K460DRAFT_404083 [Cucurbitaria berberidis CBS 394.84]